MLSQRTRHIQVHNMHKLRITGHTTFKLNASSFFIVLSLSTIKTKLVGNSVTLCHPDVIISFFFISNH